MIKIYCLNDIATLESEKLVSKEVVQLITDALKTLNSWSDELHESTFEEFNALDYGYGLLPFWTAQRPMKKSRISASAKVSRP